MATELETNIEGLAPNIDMERGKGIAKGVYYAAVAVTGRQGPYEPAFALLATDIDALEHLWEQLMGPVPLNRKATYQVAIFQRGSLQTDPVPSPEI